MGKETFLHEQWNKLAFLNDTQNNKPLQICIRCEIM